MNLTGSISIRSIWYQTPANVPGALPIKTSQPLTWNVTTGTGADLADQKFSATKTMLAGTPFQVDLTSLVDAQGNVFTMGRLKAISVVNRSQVAGQSVLMGFASATSNAFIGILSNPGLLTIPNSTPANPGAFGWISPDHTGTPVSSSNRLIQWDPGAVPITIEIELIGSTT